MEGTDGEGKASSENVSSSGGKSQAGQLGLPAQECSWNPKPLLSPSTSSPSKHDSPSPPVNIFILHVSGYEEVVRIPKGSVFIHIQEVNISLNYLGKMAFALILNLFNLSSLVSGSTTDSTSPTVCTPLAVQRVVELRDEPWFCFVFVFVNHRLCRSAIE